MLSVMSMADTELRVTSGQCTNMPAVFLLGSLSPSGYASLSISVSTHAGRCGGGKHPQGYRRVRGLAAGVLERGGHVSRGQREVLRD